VQKRYDGSETVYHIAGKRKRFICMLTPDSRVIVLNNFVEDDSLLSEPVIHEEEGESND